MKRASWAPVITTTELVKRTVLLLVLALVMLSIFAPATSWRHACALSLITASLFGLILTAVEYLPEENLGGMTSREGGATASTRGCGPRDEGSTPSPHTFREDEGKVTGRRG